MIGFANLLQKWLESKFGSIFFEILIMSVLPWLCMENKYFGLSHFLCKLDTWFSCSKCLWLVWCNEAWFMLHEWLLSQLWEKKNKSFDLLVQSIIVHWGLLCAKITWSCQPCHAQMDTIVARISALENSRQKLWWWFCSNDQFRCLIEQPCVAPLHVVLPVFVYYCLPPFAYIYGHIYVL